MEILASNPTALEGIDHLLFQLREAEGRQERRPRIVAAGQGLPHGRVRRRQQGGQRRPARRCMEALKKQPRPSHHEVDRRPEAGGNDLEGREGGLGSTAWVPGMPDTWPGWEDSAVPPGRSAITSAISASCSTSTTISRPSTAISARAAFTARALRPVHRRGDRKIQVVHERGRRSRGHLRRVAVGRARRRAGRGEFLRNVRRD